MGSKIQEMKEIINDADNSDELRKEIKRLKEQLALMKSQIDFRDKMLNAKDCIINAQYSAIKAKDEEIDLLNKRIKEYENIKK